MLWTAAVVVLLLLAAGYWWRHRSLACPANLTWLLENPYMNSVAGAERILERLRLEKGMTLLDVGSGPGRLTLPAAKRVGTRGDVVALDIQPEMLAKLQARKKAMGIDNIRTINAAAGSAKIDEAYFDRVLLVTVLGEIPNKSEALAVIYRGLKAGGILSVTEVIPDPHYTRLKTVRALCRDAGFVETECFTKPLAFTVNFSKPAER